jgi:hypothetical protein
MWRYNVADKLRGTAARLPQEVEIQLPEEFRENVEDIFAKVYDTVLTAVRTPAEEYPPLKMGGMTLLGDPEQRKSMYLTAMSQLLHENIELAGQRAVMAFNEELLAQRAAEANTDDK